MSRQEFLKKLLLMCGLGFLVKEDITVPEPPVLEYTDVLKLNFGSYNMRDMPISIGYVKETNKLNEVAFVPKELLFTDEEDGPIFRAYYRQGDK